MKCTTCRQEVHDNCDYNQGRCPHRKPIFEIKSSWTWNKNGKDKILEEKNKAKLTACINQCYNVVLVLNQKRLKYEEIMGRGLSS